MITTYFIPGSIDLEDADIVIAVDFASGWLALSTLVEHVTYPGLLQLHVLEAVLADPEVLEAFVLLGVGREVPRTDFVLAETNVIDELDTSELLVFAFQSLGHCVRRVKLLSTKRITNRFSRHTKNGSLVFSTLGPEMNTIYLPISISNTEMAAINQKSSNKNPIS